MWDTFDKWIEETDQSPLEACLNYVLNNKEFEKVIVGINTIKQLREIADIQTQNSFAPPKELSCEDLQLVNPSNWDK